MKIMSCHLTFPPYYNPWNNGTGIMPSWERVDPNRWAPPLNPAPNTPLHEWIDMALKEFGDKEGAEKPLIKDPNASHQGFPFYNIVSDVERDEMAVEIALAGYDRSDLNVVSTKSYVKVSADPKSWDWGDEDKKCYHRQGIKRESFELKFEIDEKLSFEKCSFNNGILRIKFHVNIPEAEKETMITIE